MAASDRRSVETSGRSSTAPRSSASPDRTGMYSSLVVLAAGNSDSRRLARARRLR